MPAAGAQSRGRASLTAGRPVPGAGDRDHEADVSGLGPAPGFALLLEPGDLRAADRAAAALPEGDALGRAQAACVRFQAESSSMIPGGGPCPPSESTP